MRSRMSKLECSPLHQVFPLKRLHMPLRDGKQAACLDRDNSESVIDLKINLSESVLILTIMSEKIIESMIKYICAFMKVDTCSIA